MTTIDLDQLANVTGGAGRPQAQPQAQPDAQQDAPAAGGGFLTGLDQFLGFFQSDGFQQAIGGLRQFLSSFAQPQQPQQ